MDASSRWIAGAVRTLLRRVDDLEQSCKMLEERSVNPPASSAKCVLVLEKLVVPASLDQGAAAAHVGSGFLWNVDVPTFLPKDSLDHRNVLCDTSRFSTHGRSCEVPSLDLEPGHAGRCRGSAGSLDDSELHVDSLVINNDDYHTKLLPGASGAAECRAELTKGTGGLTETDAAAHSGAMLVPMLVGQELEKGSACRTSSPPVSTSSRLECWTDDAFQAKVFPGAYGAACCVTVGKGHRPVARAGVVPLVFGDKDQANLGSELTVEAAQRSRFWYLNPKDWVTVRTVSHWHKALAESVVDCLDCLDDEVDDNAAVSFDVCDGDDHDDEEDDTGDAGIVLKECEIPVVHAAGSVEQVPPLSPKGDDDDGDEDTYWQLLSEGMTAALNSLENIDHQTCVTLHGSVVQTAVGLLGTGDTFLVPIGVLSELAAHLIVRVWVRKVEIQALYRVDLHWVIDFLAEELVDNLRDCRGELSELLGD